jgi:hypothetical protein
MGTRRSRAEWESLVAEMEASGQSVARFSARRGLKPETLQWWRWQLRRASTVVRNASASLRLLPVAVIKSAATADGATSTLVEISLSDITVRVPVGTEAGYIAALVAALRARC